MDDTDITGLLEKIKRDRTSRYKLEFIRSEFKRSIMKEFKEFMFEKIAENNTDLLFFIENKLTPKQKQVIQQRFMSNKNRIMQFNELAQKFDLSIERLRQIEFEAIFKIYYNSIGIIDAFIAWQKTRDRDKEDEE